MNTIPLSFALLCAAVLPLSAAGESYPYQDKTGLWQFEHFNYCGKSDNLGQAKNWLNGKVPSGMLPRINIMGGCSVSLDRPYPLSLSALYLGMQNSKPSVFILKKGGQIAMGSCNLPVGYLQDSTAEFRLEGGALTVGDLKDDRPNGFLYIGVGATVSGTGRFVVSSGTLVSGIRLGSDAPNTNTGTLVVQGSTPSISTHHKERNTLEIYRTGTVEFVLDANGVAPLDFRKTSLRIHEGATVRVDGARYKGEGKTIPLILYEKLIQLGPVNLEVNGFAAPYQAALTLDKKGALLKITKTAK